MLSISASDGIDMVLTSLVNSRLCVLAGAGLSMAPPSSLPSADAIARSASAKYASLYGITRPPLPRTLGEQAEFFFQQGELATVYLRTLVDSAIFVGRHNAGHEAIADFLLTRAIQAAVTTNVDTLIEGAGERIFGRVGAGIDGDMIAILGPDVAPLLKLHGCHRIDAQHTVWARGQLTTTPVAERVASSSQWLATNLLDRDLLIVGYWSDWDYLNAVLDRTLGAVRPSRVVVVDPADPAEFEDKAPSLYALGNRSNNSFYHVRSSGEEFLDRLRQRFGESFVRQVLHAGKPSFAEAVGREAPTPLTEPPTLDAECLWSMRRDLEGCLPNKPAQARIPPNDQLLGETILRLRFAGATSDGPCWLISNLRVRVIRTPNTPLQAAQDAFRREDAPVVAADVVIAVGAEAQMLPGNIARSSTPPSIARGAATRWLARPDALLELGI